MSDVANVHTILTPVIIACISFAGVVVTLVGTVCIYRWRDKVAARSRFRDTFIEMKARVINDSLSVDWVKDSMGGQEAAIIGFVRHVRKRDRVGLDAACEEYRKLRQPQQMMIGVGFSEKQRCELVDVIDQLISYADKS